MIDDHWIGWQALGGYVRWRDSEGEQWMGALESAQRLLLDESTIDDREVAGTLLWDYDGGQDCAPV